MLGPVERVERRQALGHPLELLLLEPPLLEQVGDGGGEGEGEEGHAEEVREDVERQERALQVRGRRRWADEARGQEEGERERRDEGAHDVDVKARAEGEEDHAREHRGHAQREVDALDGAHVEDQRGDHDARGVERGAGEDEARRVPGDALRARFPADEIGDEEDGGGEVHRARRKEENVGEEGGHRAFRGLA